MLPPEAEDSQGARAAVDPGLDPPNEPVAEQDRKHVVAPAPLRCRDVDLPDVVEAMQPPQEVPIPDVRVEWRKEGDTRGRPTRQEPGRDFALGLLEEGKLTGHHVAVPAHALDGHRHERSGVDQLAEQLGPRGPVGLARIRGRRPGAVPQFGLATAAAEQAVGPIP